MPTFFIIGAAKCGTSSLHAYLDLHPEISMSSWKEPRFFCRASQLDGQNYRHCAGDTRSYLSLFDPLARFRGESSTAYSMYPIFTGVPEAINSSVEDPKFIYVVRDPVERVASVWVELMSGRTARNRSRYRLQSLDEQIGDPASPANFYSWPGMYMTQIDQYLKFFPRESIHVLDWEELLTNRQSALAGTFRFLGVDPDFADPGFDVERNRSAAKAIETTPYVFLAGSRSLRRIVDRFPEGIRESAVRTVRNILLRPATKPLLDQALRTRLEDLFRPEVEELREFTGQSFPGWSI